MTGEPVRPGEPKLSDMAKIDFSTFRPIPPPPGGLSDPLYGFGPMQGRVTNLCVTTGGELDGH